MALTTLSLVGVPAQAVSGGADIPVDEFGFIAKILVDGKHGCSGALVGPQWLVTSDSCFGGDGQVASEPVARAIVGGPDLNADGGREVAVMSVVRHPDRDIALGKLDQPVFDVPTLPIASSAPAVGEALQVAGFGRTSDVWVPDRAQTAPFTVQGVDAATLDVVGQDGASTCKGDAGGPALRERDGKFELVAVNSTSWQHGCLDVTEERQGATETRVDGLDEWFRQHVPSLAIECDPPASIFMVKDDGTLWLYEHTDPANGTWGWVDGTGRQVGSGWLDTRAVAGPDGVLYSVVSNGELRRLRWTGAGWERFPNGRQYEVIDRGWGWYTMPEYRDRITVDANGHIYTVESDGRLHWRSYDPATKAWQHRALDNGWGSVNLIVAAGDGVFFARTTDGRLSRFHYDAAGQRWVEHNKTVGTGWGGFKPIMSPGADVLYGASGTDGGTLLWYRYLPRTQTWIADTGKLIGRGWYGEYAITATPDVCRLR